MRKKIVSVLSAAVITCMIFAGCGGGAAAGSSAAGSKASSVASSTAPVSSVAPASSTASVAPSDPAADMKAIVGSWPHESAKEYVYTFKEDKTGDYTMGDQKKAFTYNIEDGKLKILFKGDSAAFENVYRIEGNKLIIKDSFDKDVVYVKK